MSQLITREYQGNTFVFREDGYFNMTKAGKDYGKRSVDFLRLPSTVEYLASLGEIFPHKELVATKRGSGLHTSVGTWVHPQAGRVLRHGD